MEEKKKFHLQEKLVTKKGENFYREIVTEAISAIFDKKGLNIMAIDLRGASSLTDYVLIAEGDVDRHVIAIAQEVMKRLANLGEPISYAEGLEVGDWVVLDYLDIMIHLFTPSMREKYQIEELFSKGKLIDVSLDRTKNFLHDATSKTGCNATFKT